ncbi:MAG: LuxR C-terminal-related transcriptional regulator [Phycisphaerae bacterium]
MSLRIGLADSQTLLRQGMRQLLENHGHQVVAEAATGRQAVKDAIDCGPDLMIMESTLPELNGINTTQRIAEQCTDVRILALSETRNPATVRGMLQAGAGGYVLKQSDFEEVLAAIKTVMQGKTYLSPEVASAVVSEFVGPQSGGQLRGLSNREREVLQLIAEGYGTKKIASDLFVSVKTVETHRRNIMRKLDIHSIAGLTRYAIQQGLASIEH